MAIRRSPQQVAKRALILGALSMRGSLEVTRHPRVVEFSERLLPWLLELGCEGEICAIEREQFLTPLGLLSESQWLDVKSAGETAMFFCWAIQLENSLHLTERSNQSCTECLKILQPEAEGIILKATLRTPAEIVEFYRQTVLIQSILREARVEEKIRNNLRRVTVQGLSKLGVHVDDADIQRADGVVNGMNPERRQAAAGLIFVRSPAASWLLDERTSYWD